MMQPIRALIAEDELLARQMLATLVARDQELELVGTASDGVELRELLAEKTPDLARPSP
jgi:chemotaxis response regulator CheB